jgi:GalNAc-alpha-(1->4)-GalNAc-alpha-(1->3)-diNAcBac-PP-undecaprenol alpha-1,4-N-acetyl-D-galactosaminyltransferase
MKIVFLLSDLGAGGAERVATTLCNAWAAAGHEVTLIATFSGSSTPFYPLREEVAVVSLADLVRGSRKTVWSYARRLLTLRRLIRQQQANVVVSFLSNVNVAAILATAFTAVPVIVSIRSDPGSTPLPRPWRMACAALYRYADAVVVQTDSVLRNIGRYYPGVRRVVRVPNPLPQRLEEIVRNGQAGPRRVFLSLGRLDSQKQVDHCIAAFGELAPTHADWDLHVYGDGPARGDLEQLAGRLGLADRVIFRGQTAQPWEVMAQADAFVMPSSFEGFPNALLESMAVGLPCVVYDCPSGPAEMTRGGEDALLVPLNDQAALTQALGRVMGDAGLRQELGERARRSVLERYRLNSVLGLWDDVFRQVGAMA